MIPYIICFSITLLETYFCESMFKKNNKKIAYLFGFLAILTLSFFAGIRDLTIGSDVLGYVANIYNRASYNNLAELINLSNEEPGFVTLGFLCNKIFGNIHWFLFFAEFITATFLVLFLKNNREKQSMVFPMLIYLLLCYSESFCIIRQHIALVICLYATKFIDNKKIIIAFLFFVLAYLFHTSTIAFILIWSLRYVSLNIKKDLKKKILYIIFSILICLILISFQNIIDMLVNKFNILPERYEFYYGQNSIFVKSQGEINLFKIFYKIIWISLFLISFLIERKNRKQKYNNILPILILLIDLFIYILSSKYIVFSRISIMLFDSILLLYFKNIFNSVKKNIYNYMIISVVIISLLIVNFYFTIIIKSNTLGGYNTYPYVFEDDFRSDY